MSIGGSLGYYTGDPLRLLEDCQILRPTFFAAVPRILNRIYQSAMVSGNVPGVKGALFRRACETKLQKLHTTGDNTHPLWDRLVFRKVQAVLGGQVVMIGCGSAPITPDVMDFLKIAFACHVVEVSRSLYDWDHCPLKYLSGLRYDRERGDLHACMAERPLEQWDCRAASGQRRDQAH